MTSYMSFLLVPFKAILGGSNAGSPEQLALWSSVIEIITKSLGDDEGGETSPQRFRKARSRRIHSVLAG
jgi:hypothetical protein